MQKTRWEELAKRLTDLGYSISWQEGLTDLYDYFEWINSCKVLLSQDSLGIHIALALKKQIIGLFGSTDPREIYLYNSGRIVHSRRDCPVMPCYDVKCRFGHDCMSQIDLDEVINNVKALI